MYFRTFLFAFRSHCPLSLSLSRESGSVDWSVIRKKKGKPKEKTTTTTTTKFINNWFQRGLDYIFLPCDRLLGTNIPKEVNCAQVSFWGLTDLNVKNSSRCWLSKLEKTRLKWAGKKIGSLIRREINVLRELIDVEVYLLCEHKTLLTIESLTFKFLISNRFSLFSFINVILSPFMLDVVQLGKVITIFSPNFISSIFLRSTWKVSNKALKKINQLFSHNTLTISTWKLT